MEVSERDGHLICGSKYQDEQIEKEFQQAINDNYTRNSLIHGNPVHMHLFCGIETQLAASDTEKMIALARLQNT